MRGMLKQRYRGSWSLVLDDYETNPATGGRVRKRKWITFRGTRKQAERRLNELVHAADRGELVEPTKMTLGEWLVELLEKAIKPPRRTQSTYDESLRIVEKHITPKLGALRLQALKPLDLEAYYTGPTTLASASVAVHHAILHSALKAALRAGLVYRNVAALAENKPRARKGQSADVLAHVWEAPEARQFLATAKAAGAQPAAFYTLAIDSGARKSELAGLKWSDLDVERGRLTIQRQLLKVRRDPEFGPTKTKRVRTIELAAETLALLKAHKSHQAEVKIRNRQHYRDHGLIFAKEWGDLHGRADSLGGPLQVNTIGSREFDRLIKAAGVRRIKFHGLRHTCATLLLTAGVQANVVQHRLGHANVTMTLQVYGHAIPSAQQDAAARLAALLHG